MATSAPPPPDACLARSRRGRFRGGTLIAADVHDLGEHQRRLRNPDSYRPKLCPRCAGQRLHSHGRNQRILVAADATTRIEILRFICANGACSATWRVLPAFVARHLWRRWETVGALVIPPLDTPAPVPPRTRRRWQARLASSADQLVHLFAHHADDNVANFAHVAGFESTRLALVRLFTMGRVFGGHGIAEIAAAVDALERGVRVI